MVFNCETIQIEPNFQSAQIVVAHFRRILTKTGKKITDEVCHSKINHFDIVFGS